MEFTQEGDLFTAADDEAVALVRETHGLLNECAEALGVDVRMSTTAIVFGPGTLQLYQSVGRSSGIELHGVVEVQSFVEQAKDGTIKSHLAEILAIAAKSGSKPGWFKRNWKWLAGGAAGLGVLYLIFRKRRSA